MTRTARSTTITEAELRKAVTYTAPWADPHFEEIAPMTFRKRTKGDKS